MKLFSRFSIADQNSQNSGRLFFLFSLILFAVGLPLSSFLVSISQFLLFLSWLIDGDYKNKFRLFVENKVIWIFLILPLLDICWLLNTTDFQYALKDIKIKLPLLILPLLLGTSKPISRKELQLVLGSFVFAVFCGTIVTSSILSGIYSYPYQNVRDTSIFISHIRFGLMIVFSLVLLGYFIALANQNRNRKKLFWLFILFLWFLIFLIILQSLTSWVILFISAFFVFFIFYKQIKNKKLRVSLGVVLFVLLISVGGLIGKVCHDFYFTKNPRFFDLPTHTVRGNLYANDTLSTEKENGYYIEVLISMEELSHTWSKLSSIPFDGKDANGFPICGTMIRYLASKGLPKDQDGLLKLNSEDIRMIEKGYASCIYRSQFIPYVRVYELLWELDRYFKNGDANGKSVAQRLEFAKTAIYIISRNFWFGVGTGDVRTSYEQAYNEIHSTLKKEFQLRAHNQYLTFFVTFGIFGFLLALFSMFGPAWRSGVRNNFVLVSFLAIIFLSMINEDTLETQAGVSFYIFIYSLFLFSEEIKK